MSWQGSFRLAKLTTLRGSLISERSSLSLSTDLTGAGAPFTSNTTLKFCSYNGSACCNSTEDLQLQKDFQSMNISDPSCAAVMKSILCARCDPFSAELFTVASTPRLVPLLCNSTVSANSSQSNQAAHNFCSNVWDTCRNVSFSTSPFAPSLKNQAGLPDNSKVSVLNQYWQSEADFCTAFGGESSDGSVCFDGQPVTLNNSGTASPPHGMCLEKIANGSYVNMVGHPDGSNRAFFASQPGKIWLATNPEQGAGGTLELDESNPFVDLTDEVYFDSEFGMMSIAFHPNFAQNGRFFASFNCDKVKWPGCTGKCSCNSAVNCDPSGLVSDNGAQPCQYQSVVAEFTVNGSSAQPFSATSAKPTEVRRIFTMGLPFTIHHGGQILFGPEDGYLYFMMGDGGGVGDPYNFAQNKKSLLGKIMRLDVDNIPSAAEIAKLGLWGNYSIPKDNPYNSDTELQPEIWAYGFRNPWRCSFDSERSSYFMCGDVGEDRYEEVDLITKDGNYGWRVYEGPLLYTPPESPGGSTPVNSISPIFPVLGYFHSEVNGKGAVIGGYFYRSVTDPCMYGRYLFADVYGTALWAGTEIPEDSGNFTRSAIPFSCAADSPIPCTYVPGSSLPALGIINSFGEDNRKDIYLLTSSGVYRVVSPTRCNYTCPKENVTAVQSPGPPSAKSRASQFSVPCNNVVLLFCALLLILLGFV
ncbi:HIPL1 protein [Morella rubra]|uniref:HIPL1 protein n=1 Tax=Morella rubra TaxID=262757 RepID=A0A6A1VVE7_9ROSI|nr:HIPL1 protein [Morella rubra]